MAPANAALAPAPLWAQALEQRVNSHTTRAVESLGTAPAAATATVAAAAAAAPAGPCDKAEQRKTQRLRTKATKEGWSEARLEDCEYCHCPSSRHPNLVGLDVTKSSQAWCTSARRLGKTTISCHALFGGCSLG